MVEVRNTDPQNVISVGEIVDCTVEQIMPYGAFVRITRTGRKGMIHISELSYSFVKNINDVLNIQDNIRAKIIRIDDKGRIDLSLKQTAEPPQAQPKPARHTSSFNRDGNRESGREFHNPHENHEGRENFRPTREWRENTREFHEVRSFHDMQEAYRENNPDEADSFEKKMASFLKTSEAKITDLNTRNSARTGRSTRRRNNNRDY